MSLSARRILRLSCHIVVPPRRHSAMITEPIHSVERVEPADSTVDQRTSPVDHALINGAKHSPHQYVSTVQFLLWWNAIFIWVHYADAGNNRPIGLMLNVVWQTWKCGSWQKSGTCQANVRKKTLFGVNFNFGATPVFSWLLQVTFYSFLKDLLLTCERFSTVTYTALVALTVMQYVLDVGKAAW